MAVVGLSQTLYSVTEEDLQAWVYVVMENLEYPEEECPIAYFVEVLFSTIEDTAGR